MRILVAVKRVLDYNARVRVRADKVSVSEGAGRGVGVEISESAGGGGASAEWRCPASALPIGRSFHRDCRMLCFEMCDQGDF